MNGQNGKQHFQRFCNAPELGSKPEERQIDTLLYIMGHQARDIFSAFQLTNSEAKSFNVAQNNFDMYFVPQRNGNS